ncbi:hypothetical protein ACWNT8_05515 [Pigmentibacter ruber]|nr:hypothetical protein GTC16762_29040 [Pigmentibacter ruber]
MKKYLTYIKKSFTIIFILSAAAHAQSSEERESAKTNIFCSTQDGKWEWLKENGNLIEISGKWVSYYKDYDGRYLFLKYFEVDEGAEKISQLRNQCIAKFGNNYSYAQPADSRFDRWYLLGTKNGVAAPGHFYMKYACKYCFYRSTGNFERNHLAFNNIDLKEFIEKYFDKYY